MEEGLVARTTDRHGTMDPHPPMVVVLATSLEDPVEILLGRTGGLEHLEHFYHNDF